MGEADLAVLRDLWIPIWVFDPDSFSVHWGNEEALRFWGARSQRELREREFQSISEASLTRLKATMERLLAGLKPVESWTFYPLGKPKRVRLRQSLFRFADGRAGLLVEALPVETPPDPGALRAQEALHYLRTMVSIFAADGRPLLRNPAAIRAFGVIETGAPEARLGDAFVEPEARRRLFEQLGRGESFVDELRVRTLAGEGWHRIDARWTDDPVTGDRTILVYEVNVDASHETRIKLENARAEAERASSARSLFLASVSHELRTPIAGMVGLLELLRGGELPAEHREHVELLGSSVDLLLTVVNDVLDLTKIDAGQLVIEQIPFFLRECVQGAAALCAQRARDKGLALEVSLAPGVPERVVGDPMRLRQILLNLLTNAIKFTPAGRVELVVEVRPGERLALSVRDTGVGIDRETQARLFEPFVQGHASTSRRYGGTGLGLAIARRLAGLMGGELLLESEPGKGSVFCLLMPLERSTLPLASGAASSGRPAEEPLCVLLVEDNPTNRRVGVALLEKRGHRVLVAEDGEQAVRVLRERDGIDVVLMDIQMPVMDGVTATRVIRALPAPAGRVPIIALTADALREDLDHYLAAGFDEYLTKPVDWDVLFTAVRRLVRSRGEAREGSLDGSPACDPGSMNPATDSPSSSGNPPVAREELASATPPEFSLAYATRARP